MGIAMSGIAEVMGSNPVESPEFFKCMRRNQLQTFVPQEVHSRLQYLSRHGYTLLSYDIPITGKHEPNELTCSPLGDFIAQLVRALHRHRRGHGFESR